MTKARAGKKERKRGDANFNHLRLVRICRWPVRREIRFELTWTWQVPRRCHQYPATRSTRLVRDNHPFTPHHHGQRRRHTHVRRRAYCAPQKQGKSKGSRSGRSDRRRQPSMVSLPTPTRGWRDAQSCIRVEKYRPVTLDDVVSHQDITATSASAS